MTRNKSLEEKGRKIKNDRVRVENKFLCNGEGSDWGNLWMDGE